jgi:hypothetical protein
MARTVPFPFEEHVEPAAAAHSDPEAYTAVLMGLIERYKFVLADADKASDLDAAAYNEGMADAFAEALIALLDPPESERKAYFGH